MNNNEKFLWFGIIDINNSLLSLRIIKPNWHYFSLKRPRSGLGLWHILKSNSKKFSGNWLDSKLIPWCLRLITTEERFSKNRTFWKSFSKILSRNQPDITESFQKKNIKEMLYSKENHQKGKNYTKSSISSINKAFIIPKCIIGWLIYCFTRVFSLASNSGVFCIIWLRSIFVLSFFYKHVDLLVRAFFKH